MNHAFLNIDYDKSLAVECLKKKAFTITDENNNDDFMDIAVINDIDFKKYIRSLINLPFPVEVVFLVNPPNSIYYKPHIDLCRQCAINFPVNVYGNVWTAKNQDDIYFKINNIGGKDEVVFPSIDDTNKHLYNKFQLTDRPVLLNTSAPHTASNPNNTQRFIISCSIFTHSYQQVKDIFASRNQINTL